jgi:PhnB protein
MAQINPYLNFKGNCEEAFDFYKSVLGGEYPFVGRFKDMPPSQEEDCGPLPPEMGEKIMHMSLVINGGQTVLMGSDATGPMADSTIIGNNIHLSINAESEEEAHRVFDGLSAGGKVTMPINKTFWGALFGMFTDKFGINWMVNYDYPRD